MSTSILSPPRIREFTPSGTVLSGAKLYFYLAGTTTPGTVYSDLELDHPHSNPVVADTGGLFPAIFIDPNVAYDVTCTNSAGATQWTVSGVTAEGSDILSLYSRQTAEPFAHTYITFNEPDGTAKGFVGFAGTLDNRFVVNTREDVRIRFLTGTPGDPTSSIERASVHGTLTASFINISSPSANGGSTLRLTNSDATTVRATIGQTSTGDDDLDIQNNVSGGHIDFLTVGTGRIRLPLASGTAAAPMLAVSGDTNTGFYSSGADVLNLSTGGTLRVIFASAMATFSTILKTSSDGVVTAPSLVVGSYAGDAIGLYHIGSGTLGVSAGGTLAGSFYANGTFRAPTAGSAPGSAVNGQIYYNTATDKLQVRAAGAWVDLH